MQTAVTTVLIGVTVYVLGQLLLVFVIQPLQEFRRTIGKIDSALVFYANAFGNAEILQQDHWQEAWRTIRTLAADLSANYQAIPCYAALAFVRFVPTSAAVGDARRGLIGLSNSGRAEGMHIQELVDEVRRALKLSTS